MCTVFIPNFIGIAITFLENNKGYDKYRESFDKMYHVTLHTKMGTIKDRNGMGLIEAEDIKWRWQESTELYPKDLSVPHNHDGVITHLKPHIL